MVKRMELSDIYSLIEHVEKSNLSKFSLEFDNVKLSLEKATGATLVSQAAPVVVTTNEEAVTGVQSTDENLITLKAPFVGTFYRASGPGEEPFVMIGQSVKKGDVVGIIEAMKMMNEIVAPEDGVVDSILASDGEMVEYDKVLITFKKIKPERLNV